jgi:hypothetical protein
MGGAVAKVAADATAFAHRSAAFVTNVIAQWENAEDDAENIAWAREHFTRLEPHARGAYVNFLGEEGDASGAGRVRREHVSAARVLEAAVRSGERVSIEPEHRAVGVTEGGLPR